MNAAAALDSSIPTPDDAPRVRLMCSLGGRILPRPQDNQLRYVGGDTRIVAVHRSATFSALHDKLSKLGPSAEVTIKYQLPNEDLDALISVTGDEDVENMMEEHDRLVSSPGVAARTARLRLFIFPAGDDAVPAGFGSMLDGSGSRRDSWFLDVLNGGTGRLERGRSDASSLLSEVPDYLFGFDNNSEDSRPKVNASEPSSPMPAMNSPKYSSTSSVVDPSVCKDYVPTPAVWHDVQEPVQVYYMPPPFRPVPVQYFNPVQPAAGGPMYRPSPFQGVWSNPGQSVPVYSTYPVAGDGRGMLKGPLYPGTVAAPPASGEMAGAAAMGRGSQN